MVGELETCPLCGRGTYTPGVNLIHEYSCGHSRPHPNPPPAQTAEEWLNNLEIRMIAVEQKLGLR